MYNHLKVKTEYSICSSTIKIPEAISLAKANNMKSLAICDDGNLFGSLEFSNACVSAGIKPIIGVEMKLCTENVHIIGPVIFFAKTLTGYQNILKITNSDEAINNSSNILLSTIKQFSDDIIAISSSVEVLKSLTNIFSSGNIFAEISRFTNEQNEVDEEKALVEFSSDNKIPLVATNASYFPNSSLFASQDALFCVKNGRFTLEDERPMMTPNHYFQNDVGMQKLFSDIPSAILHTEYIAKQCNYYPTPHNPMFPKFAEDEGRELRQQASDGLDNRLNDFGIVKGYTKEDYTKRLEYEIDVISNMGFEGYFLIVSDFIKWSKNNGVAVGPGRGSGAGSLVAYCLYITDLDPLRYGLLFERFLNPERVSMPDFDIDFCQEERYKVINYVQTKYGKDKVSSIATFGRLQARAVLKDVGRVLQIPYIVVDRICKMVPFNPVAPVTLEQAIAMDKDLQEQKANDEIIENLIEIGTNLEGLVRHLSTHAAGIIIANEDLAKIVPLYKTDDQDLPAVGYSMKMAEMAGLVKFDFLGLKTLTIIKRTCLLVKENFNVEIIPSQIPLDDQDTFKLLQSGLTKGVFQLDSSICRDAMKQMQVDMIDDIIALTSLNRPGPMENIPSFIARKTGKEKVEYVHPLLEEVLKETYGIIIYQEQVIKIAQVLAGYSLGEADILRRAMGKKDKEEMDQQQERFISGAKENGLSVKKAEEIFSLVGKFAGYGFNKSHAAAYSVISFHTAYLKAHYKLEFYASILNLDIHNTDNLNIFIAEARQSGVAFVTPNVNTSSTSFQVKDGKIEYALSAIKGVGEMVTVEIEKERSKKNFDDIFDFVERLGSKYANKKVLEGLIKTGAFKELHTNSNELLQNIQIILSIAESKQDNNNFSLFDASEMKAKPKLRPAIMFTDSDALKAEFDAFGFYLSSHPLLHYTSTLQEHNVKTFDEVKETLLQDGKEISLKMSGVIGMLKQRSGSRGRFAFLHISDLTSVFEVAIFKDDIIEKSRDSLVIGKVVIMNVSASIHESGNPRLIVNDIALIEDKEKIVQFKGAKPRKNIIKREVKKVTQQTQAQNVENFYSKLLIIETSDILSICKIKEFPYGETEVLLYVGEYKVRLGMFQIPMTFIKNLQQDGSMKI